MSLVQQLCELLEQVNGGDKNMKKDEILEILGSVREEVKQEYKAEIKGIFGSYAFVFPLRFFLCVLCASVVKIPQFQRGEGVV
jgi:hypothetical protein